MRKWGVAIVLSWLVSACVVDTETLEGKQGPQGPIGKAGPPGVSPFVANSDGSIYYTGGNVGIGTMGPNAALEVAGDAVIGRSGADARLKLNPDSSRGSVIATNGGSGDNYNGLWLASNTRMDGSTPSNDTLPSWGVDIGGIDNINNPGSFDTFNVMRRPPGGSFSRLMTIDGSGNVGIGTTTPGAPLHVFGQGLPTLALETREGAPGSSAGLTMINKEGGAWTLSADGPTSDFSLRSGLSSVNTKFFIQASSGNIGIGNTSPKATLDVTGTARLAKFAAPPFPCDVEHDGTIALTHVTKLCVCNGTGWLFVADDNPCMW